MKQFSFNYCNADSFEGELIEFAEKLKTISNCGVIFRIFSEILDKSVINAIGKSIEKVFPEADYMGCSTSGNIIDCRPSENITVVCTVFEKPSTRHMIRSFSLPEDDAKSAADGIINIVNENPWVKAIEIYFTIISKSYTEFCRKINVLNPDIQVFGGVACSDDITSSDSFVFTKSEGYLSKSIAVVFYGGDDFHVHSIKTTGWKQLKRKFRVTKSNGSTLYELDNIPAYEVYRRYLAIPNDENFFFNTLEFPLLYEHDNTTILRVPVASNQDGSITLSSDIEEGAIVRFSYGDPRTVVEKISNDSCMVSEFQPDIIHIFSCAARRAFWNTNESTYELSSLKNIAPSSGFFSHGEFVRKDGFLNQHNVTLVIAFMREGEKKSIYSEKESHSAIESDLIGKMPLVSRLATFIAESARELEEYNSRLQLINEKLKQASIIDGLTGLFNRHEIQSRIEKSLENVQKSGFSIIMLDIDNFKQVNDTYGHQRGDEVIIALSNIIRSKQLTASGEHSSGRWGGEEFMVLLPDTKLSTASFIAELIRNCFSEITFQNMRSQTVSVGVTQANINDTIDTICTRVDSALYKAKKSGKNIVVAE